MMIASAVLIGWWGRIGTMPVLRRPRPLWHLLVVLGSATVVPLLLFGAYAGFRIAEAQFHGVREDLAIAARDCSSCVVGKC